MDKSGEEKVHNPEKSIRSKCVQCIKGSNLMKTLVIVVCTGIVIQQLSTCIQKLVVMPITTYAHFDFNTTLLYPSITVCKEPAYKYSEMGKYGLSSHPMYTSIWRNFDFNNNSLDAMWDDITFDANGYFVQYGLEGTVHNVSLKETIGFTRGRCYTVSPIQPSTKASRSQGYSIMLQHEADELETFDDSPPGFHVFIHYSNEPYSEVSSQNGGLVEYLYVHVGEEVDVKLTVSHYKMVPSDGDPCTNNNGNYNANNCTTEHVWRQLEEEVGCSGPWMISEVPRCSNYHDFRALISAYLNLYQSHEYDRICLRFCEAFLYNAYVMGRHNNYQWETNNQQAKCKTKQKQYQTQLYIHFNSMMVSVYEEQYNYDWNLFVSDIGGSVGFLLGLSVIGLLGIITRTCLSIMRPVIKSRKTTSIKSSSEGSTTTVEAKDLETVYQEWQLKVERENKF